MIERPSLPIQAFEYDLPDQCIAYTPSAHRSDSKLLVWKEEIIGESTYAHIADFIPEKSTLIFNNSKVIAARILFEKYNKTETAFSNTSDLKESNSNSSNKNENSIIEIFCLEPSIKYSPVSIAMQATKKVEWICLVGGAKKWKDGWLEKSFQLQDKKIIIQAKKIEALDGKFLIEFSWEEDIHFSEIIEQIGNIPLPPYIQRATTPEDKDRYQTTYAIEEGSVAAPTAGLHFNENIFNALAAKKIDSQFLTLHVGAGTFLPVKTENISDHPMHAEFFEVPKSVIQFFLQKEFEKEKLENNQKAAPVISVGTTSLRTIESLYWFGVKLIQFKKTATLEQLASFNLKLLQWDANDLNELNISKKEALTALLDWMELKKLTKLIASTELMIVPGYSFRLCNGLITNFHQPKSTLLLIIAAITGDKWKNIYKHAIEHQYRFLSYGDGSLFWMANY
jgi:S-adenosylmethionine:tRNA ribosyltransferase-isomerase